MLAVRRAGSQGNAPLFIALQQEAAAHFSAGLRANNKAPSHFLRGQG
jgi:hypothetical protein